MKYVVTFHRGGKAVKMEPLGIDADNVVLSQNPPAYLFIKNSQVFAGDTQPADPKLVAAVPFDIVLSVSDQSTIIHVENDPFAQAVEFHGREIQ